MANSGKNSNTSQFFFTLAAAPQCDGACAVASDRWLHTCPTCSHHCARPLFCAGKHTVFGKVVEGLHILERISECGDPRLLISCPAHVDLDHGDPFLAPTRRLRSGVTGRQSARASDHRGLRAALISCFAATPASSTTPIAQRRWLASVAPSRSASLWKWPTTERMASSLRPINRSQRTSRRRCSGARAARSSKDARRKRRRSCSSSKLIMQQQAASLVSRSSDDDGGARGRASPAHACVCACGWQLSLAPLRLQARVRASA